MKPIPVPPRQVHVTDRFASPASCRAILRHLEACDWHSSMVLRHGARRYQTEVQENFRTSLSTRHEWFTEDLREIVARLEQKLWARFGCDPRRLEPWQATRYAPGDHFGYHLDAGSWGRSRVDEPIPPDQRPRSVPEFIGVVGDELPQMRIAMDGVQFAGDD